ncbi:MAG: preprotein translocase subunit SecY [Planctomycetes bacterium]|nr:preprotein translocase subunit SecY [Planctomycetota bacterium]
MQILESFRNIFKIKELSHRIFFTLAILLVFRLGSHVLLPGVDESGMKRFQEMGEQLGPVWYFLQIFSGGALANLAVFSLGIMPYITSSIIMQLMTKVSANLEAIAKEGPSGQRKISQYTRYLTVPICVVQGFFAVRQLNVLQSGPNAPQLVSGGFGSTLTLVIGMTAGALFVMWLGEQITERGIGNGASVLIMAGILDRMPGIILMLIEKSRTQEVAADAIVLMGVLYVGAIAATVFVTQAQRRIPVQHAKHFRGRRVWMGSRNYLPLRVNTSGVMPVIFASSLLTVPSMLAMVPGLGFMNELFAGRGFFYMAGYIAMIFFFAYFWTYLFFPPHEMANNLKEYGSFVPGIRPGENTSSYLNGILSRITLAGAAFLCMIALLPDLVSAWLGLQRFLVAFLGGTGILIVVGVCLDVAQKMESYLLMHQYEGFVAGGIRGRR